MTKFNSIIFFASLILLASCNTEPSQTKCMFIGAAPGAENQEYDQYIIPQLEEWGYIVEKHDATKLSNYTDEDYEQYDFIFLSESTSSTDMEALRSIPKPMLNSDGWGAKASALAFCSKEQVGILEPAKPVVILDKAADHPFSAGYQPGTVLELGNVLLRKDPCLVVWAKPTIPVIPIAGLESDPSKLVVYGIEKGTQNALGTELKNRVATVGIHAWCYDVVTEDGVNLVKTGIDWILDEN